MAIKRLNHAVLWVSDAQRSATFYAETLGFRIVAEGPGFAFLQASGSTNDHDLGLMSVGAAAGPSGAGKSTVGLYHLAWEVETLAELENVAAVLTAHGALVGASDHSTSKSLYGKDPDGIEFEIEWMVPLDLLDDAVLAGRMKIGRLDIEREKQRYGADTRGGIGISTVLA